MINIGDLRKIVVGFPPWKSLEEQAALVEKLDAIQEAADQLADVYTRKLAALDELKHSCCIRPPPAAWDHRTPAAPRT